MFQPLEYLRPWKLLTLAIGLGLLIYGAAVYQISDWDVGVSVVMALSTPDLRGVVDV